MTSAIVIHCACASREEAGRIAEALIDARLAACVQLSAIESVYRWQGEIARAPETMLHAKTMATRFAAATALIQRLHSYDLPEIIALPIVDGAPGYVRWLVDEVASTEQPDTE